MRTGTTRSASIGDRRGHRAGRRADRPADDPRCDPRVARRGAEVRLRPRHAASRPARTRSSRRRSIAARRRRRDRRARRALRSDRRLDDRRVPRPPGPRVPRPPAGAARGGRRDRDAGRARRRERPAAGAADGPPSTARAILLAWVPGDAGPDAIADVLTGAVNPGGKLPISIPRHVGQVPVDATATTRPAATRSPRATTSTGPVAPLWPFGFGLSYTTFAVSDLRLDRTEVPDRRRRGHESAVDVDEHRRRAPVTRSSSSTSATRRRRSPGRSASCAASGASTLEPGERRTVTFRLSTEQFAYVGADYRRVIEPGHDPDRRRARRRSTCH